MSAPPESGRPPSLLRRQVLLVVDDDPAALAALQALLSSSLPDIKVLTASSGAGGMVIARANILDMVVSNLRMPKMDGIEFLRQAKVVQADIPMVIMAADDESEFAKRAIEVAGLKLVVPRPFNIEALAGLIGGFLQASDAVAPGASSQADGGDHSSRRGGAPARPSTGRHGGLG